MVLDTGEDMTFPIEKADLTILVVDDNPVNVRLAGLILQKEGYKTVSASDGISCVETAERLVPDLILMDIVMPEMDGLEACKLLKKGKKTQHIPVIFITANTDDQTLKDAFAAGGTDYVRKPINREELLARIKAALREKFYIQDRIEKEKLSAVLETAGAVCHEMNQPLQFLTWSCDTLIKDLSSNEAIINHLQDMKAHIQRISDIVRKLTSITRYETRDYVRGESIIDIEKASRPDL